MHKHKHEKAAPKSLYVMLAVNTFYVNLAIKNSNLISDMIEAHTLILEGRISEMQIHHPSKI
eukprot:c21957_g1_i1 orf=176-361(+)